MATPRTDAAGIRQVIRALKAAGHTLLEVNNGGEDHVPVTTEAEALDECTAADEAYLFVKLANGTGVAWVRFVLGNDPEEVVCDHTLSLSPVLDPLTDSWGN